MGSGRAPLLTLYPIVWVFIGEESHVECLVFSSNLQLMSLKTQSWETDTSLAGSKSRSRRRP